MDHLGRLVVPQHPAVEDEGGEVKAGLINVPNKGEETVLPSVLEVERARAELKL